MLFDEICCDVSCVHKMKNTEPKSRVFFWHFNLREQKNTKWPHVITFATSRNFSHLMKKLRFTMQKLHLFHTFRPKLHGLNFVYTFLQVTHNFFYKKFVSLLFENIWQGNVRPSPGKNERLRAFLITHFLI